MQSIRFMLMAALVVCSSSLFAQSTQTKTDTIKVYGECGMCKNRIQKALKVEGITTAVWDTETKLLTVTYDPEQITNDEIQKKVVAVGHDTEKYSATVEAYIRLPGCCKYDRKKTGNDNKN